MARIEDLVAYVGTTAAVTAACVLAMNAEPARLVREEARAPQARRALTRTVVQMPEEYRREFGEGIAACFDRDNPPSPEMMDNVNSLYFFNSRYELGTRWSSAALASGAGGTTGDPITLYWSFVPDGLSIPNGVGEGVANSELFARMDALFAGVGGRTRWVQQFVRAFQRWESLSGLTYSRITVGGNDWDDGASWSANGAVGLRGDVRISMKNIDGVNGILAYDSFPGAGSGGNMVIDRSENWAQGSTGNTPFRFLRNVLTHEHGHGLGFDHVCPSNQTKLMEPFVSLAYDGPQQDDIRAVQRFYGDIYEPNNTSAQSVDIGTLGTSGGFVLGAVPTTVPGDTIVYPNVVNSSTCSIDANGELDWYKFTATSNILATFTLAPIGSTYAEAPQDANCNTGTDFNALAVADLSLRLFSSNGSTTLALQNATAAGVAETIPTFLLSANELYHMVVLENNTPSESQLYRITVTSNGGTAVSASDGVSSTAINLTWTNIPGATQYQVFRGATNVFASATQVATPAVNSFSDTAVSPNQTFFYWVKATQVFGGFSSTQFVGGPEQGSTSGPANTPPVANAGADQNVRDPEGDGSQNVTLHGEGSTDGDGVIVSYVWKEGALTVAVGATPTISLSAGVHTLSLTVTDDDGAIGTDNVQVTVVSNNAPTANAGLDQTVTDADNSGGEIVDLDGGASVDGDGSIATYRWTEGPDEVGTGVNPTIILPVGVHTIVLTVTDNEGRTSQDSVTIDVQAGAPVCPADFNGDGFLDFFDYDDYVSCFETGLCPDGRDADFNGDGFADFFDYDDFVTAFEAGC